MGMVSKDAAERATKGKSGRAIVREKTQQRLSSLLILSLL